MLLGLFWDLDLDTTRPSQCNESVVENLKRGLFVVADSGGGQKRVSLPETSELEGYETVV